MISEESIKKILEIYRDVDNDEFRDILRRYGWIPSDPYSYEWWGGYKNQFDIIVSAILVKMTRWANVDRAMNILRQHNLNSPEKLASMDIDTLSRILMGIRFGRQKARTIIELSRFILNMNGLNRLGEMALETLRSRLLEIKGLGMETVDTILLFAFNKPIFPLARMSVRVLRRYGVEIDMDYNTGIEIAEMFDRDLYKLKYLHASLVTIAKMWCREKRVLCNKCVLSEKCLKTV